MPTTLSACFSGIGTVLLRTQSSDGVGDLKDISLGSPCLWDMEMHRPWEMGGFKALG